MLKGKGLFSAILVALLIGAAAGWLLRGTGAAEARKHLQTAATTLDDASTNAASLIDGLSHAQEDASTVTTRITTAAATAGKLTETTDAIAETVTAIEDHIPLAGSTLDKLEQAVSSDRKEEALALVKDLRDQQAAQAALVTRLRSQITGLQLSLKNITLELDDAHSHATGLTETLETERKTALVVRQQLQDAKLGIETAERSLAAQQPVPWLVGAGALAAGLLVGGLWL